MLQNAKLTAFTVSQFLRENQQRRVKLPPPPTLALNKILSFPGKIKEERRRLKRKNSKNESVIYAISHIPKFMQ